MARRVVVPTEGRESITHSRSDGEPRIALDLIYASPSPRHGSRRPRSRVCYTVETDLFSYATSLGCRTSALRELVSRHRYSALFLYCRSIICNHITFRVSSPHLSQPYPFWGSQLSVTDSLEYL